VASEAQHKELVEKINQLNILRESNATLRTESEAQAKRARELETKLQVLSSQLEPAKDQNRQSQAELEARDAHIKRLEEESRRWQERNTQLLTKVCHLTIPLYKTARLTSSAVRSHRSG
jgi:nucleoprotein TPR